MIHFDAVSKSYTKGNVILKEITLDIKENELVCIIGSSGSGKTTLMKMINRLITPSSGTITINGENIEDQDPVELRRNIGYVIQQTGLFPHMTIKENLELIPKVQKRKEEDIVANTKKYMEMVGLDPNYLDRYPTELSGGQQQRVGVARAFAIESDIILMDEPFSALDPMTRSDLQDELILLQEKMKKTIVFVTHDMDEAVKIADRICIVDKGEILQYDTPENILKHPVNEFVENFVGQNRIWSSPEFIKVRDIMIQEPFTCTREMSVLKCMDRMRTRRVDTLLVIDSATRHLEGIVRAKQIRRENNNAVKAKDVMEEVKITLKPDQNIIDALTIVNENRQANIPVVDDIGLLKGLITRTSLVTALSQQYIEVEVD